jgi:predicted DNA-binding transcriptional regulator AlpA
MICNRENDTVRDALENLPHEVTQHRVLTTAEAAALCRYSTQHFRELYRTGQVPAPIRLSARRYGWKLSVILAWLDSKATDQVAA